MRDIRIAPGAPITITLRNGTCSDPGMFCLTERPEDELTLTIGDLEIVAAEYEIDTASEIKLQLMGSKAGRTTLTVRYRDLFGNAYEDAFTLHVSPVSRVEWSFECEDRASEPDFVIGPKFRAEFDLEPVDHSGNPLLVGDLPLLDTHEGFVVDESSHSDADLAIVGPSAPGLYTLRFVGSETEPLTFEVYDPKSLLPTVTVTDDPAPLGTRARFGYALPDTKVCDIPSATRRAIARVEQGDCRIGSNFIEIVGDIAFNLQSTTDASLSGTGPCLISLTDEVGHRAQAWVESVVPARALARSGTLLGPAPLEITDGLSSFDSAEEGPKACRQVETRTNGECEVVTAGSVLVLPGIGCLFDVGWATAIWEPGDDTPVTDALLGVGLRTELHTEIRYTTLGGLLTLGVTPPSGLVTQFEPSDGVELASVGCTASDTQVFALYPARAGSTEISLTADNTFGVDERITVQAEEVTYSTFTPWTGSWPDASETNEHLIFVENSIRGDIGYRSAEGAVLRGLAPLAVSSTSAAAKARIQRVTATTWDIFSGESPTTIAIATPISGDVHRIRAVDETAISTIGGVTPELDSATKFPLCFDVQPLDERGVAIQGKPPQRARLELEGDVDVRFSGFTTTTCIVGESPGDLSLRWSWGSDERTQTVHFVGG